MVHALSLRPGELVAEKYRVLSRSRVQRGVVTCEVEEIENGRPFRLSWLAMAQPDARLRDAFRRELEQVGALEHGQLQSVHAVLEHDAHTLWLEEPREEDSLESLLLAGLPQERSLALWRGASEAVMALHALGIVHGSLSPDCLLVTKSAADAEPTLRLVDVGLARLRTGGADTNLSMQTQQLGAFAYLSPEQLRGARELDVRMDVYALAAVLFRMLAGRPPIEASNYLDLALKLGQLGAPKLASLAPNVPETVARAVDAALAPDPLHRFASVEALVRAVFTITSSRATVARKELALEERTMRQVLNREQLLSAVSQAQSAQALRSGLANPTPQNAESTQPAAHAPAKLHASAPWRGVVAAIVHGRSAPAGVKPRARLAWLAAAAFGLMLVLLLVWLTREAPTPGTPAPRAPVSAPTPARNQPPDNSDWE